MRRVCSWTCDSGSLLGGVSHVDDFNAVEARAVTRDARQLHLVVAKGDFQKVHPIHTHIDGL